MHYFNVSHNLQMTSFEKPKRRVDSVLLNLIRDMTCLKCGTHYGIEAAHVKSRGSGGDDVWHNVVPLCRTHHHEQHKVGWPTFVETSARVRKQMEERGWSIENLGGVKKMKYSAVRRVDRY